MGLKWKSFSAAAFAACCLQPALAQEHGSQFPDTPANHWAYQAVQSLANKGMVKGYKDGKLLAAKDLSRFEFATILNRVLLTLDDMVAAKAGQPPKDGRAPNPRTLTQDTLNQIQVLTDAFGTELATIEADVKKAHDDIDALRSAVSDAKDTANRAQSTADDSYGAGPNRKFSISGYIQARYISSSSGDGALYPSGVAAPSNPYNGNYMEGGSPDSFVVRRSRVKVVGQVTPNTKYAVQVDASGLTNGTNQAVTAREGNITYTPGDGSSKNPAFTIGLLANPFGYMLPLSGSNTTSPEKPLAFNETSAGIFANQDYDRGAQVSFAPGQMKFTFALLNGSAYGTNDTDRLVDEVLRAAYASKDKQFGFGASLYNGHISYVGATPYVDRKKQLVGIDAQYTSTTGPFALGEYVNGIYEQRTWFDVPTLKITSAAAPGNRIAGYYLTAGYAFDMHSAHPWKLAASYDMLQRATSGSGSGSNWNDQNLGFGAIYNLDQATTFRLWYIAPSAVAHPGSEAAPKKVGLITAEVQVKF